LEAREGSSLDAERQGLCFAWSAMHGQQMRKGFSASNGRMTTLSVRTIAALSLALCSSLLAPSAGCASGAGNSRSTTPIGAAGTPSPAPISLSLESLSGEPLELASLRGRAVLVIAFNHDDLRSQATLRDAERVARAHPETLTVVALCGNPGSFRTLRLLLETFARVLELEATKVVMADDRVREGTSPLGAIEHVPTTILINRAGVVSRTVVGLIDQRAIEELVRPALPPGG
jgi:hypothetical protein